MATLSKGLRQNYNLLYQSLLIRPARRAAVDQMVRRITASKARYQKVAKAVGMPWYVVGIIHSLEAGGNFTKHMHNGDPLTARTTHVPAGRPPRGNPPFTWEASAQDALQLHGFDRWHDWGVAGVMFKLEQYNGWGYRQFHPQVLSPYLWSFSQHYQKGKYVADGHFDPAAVSQQCGAAVLLRRMVDRDLIPAWKPLPAGPLFRYSGATVAPRGVALQRFLNTLPGNQLEEDGKLGPSSSQAVQRAFGHLLAGDPRAPGHS
jgi:lysozyme family protein